MGRIGRRYWFGEDGVGDRGCERVACDWPLCALSLRRACGCGRIEGGVLRVARLRTVSIVHKVVCLPLHVLLVLESMTSG